MCLLGLLASCGPGHKPTTASAPGRPQTWIVVRDAGAARRATAPTAPALAVRPAGAASAPEVLPLERTRVAVTAVGPIVAIERTKVYATGHAGVDTFVSFTPPETPERQDWSLHVGGRALTVLVRNRAEADALARGQAGMSLVASDADGRVVIPAGTSAAASVELAVDTIGLVPWREGAYELTVPRVPGGDVALAADVYGPGPIVAISSVSHAIDTVPQSLAHLRVELREPETLRDEDFVLRYRVDPNGHPGAFVVDADPAGGGVVGVVVHPFEAGHEPVGASDVRIDWNGTTVSDVRPADLGRVAAGTPVVVLARVQGAVTGPIKVHARVGKQARDVALAQADAVPRAGLRALPLLWARAGHVTVTARR